MKETATISPKERVFSECISSCEIDMILLLKTKEQGSRGDASGRSAGILNRSLKYIYIAYKYKYKNIYTNINYIYYMYMYYIEGLKKLSFYGPEKIITKLRADLR